VLLRPRQIEKHTFGDRLRPAYSVEKLHADILPEILSALERLKLQGAEGPTASHDLQAQLPLRCQTASLWLVFGNKLIQW
jgi:hypothetical protein